MQAKPLPVATYRVQLKPGFKFQDVERIADYLADLGVSHLYASPCLEAVPGSTHGYDVVDCGAVRGELGGAEAHGRMCRALAENGLSQLIDIVPNHMGIGGRSNRWWWDVLRCGPSSPYAKWFDIDWDAPEARVRGKVLLPVLGDHFGRVIEKGEIRVEPDEGGFVVRYYDHTFPLAPGSLENLGINPEQVNRDPDAMERLLREQHYRLAWWRTAAHELNYRRFFDINGLVGVRVEEPKVFDATHRLFLQWVREGCVTGLRIDHPDGLRDPAGYFLNLRRAAPDAWIVVEKILTPLETMRADWPVDGSTGYDFLHVANGLWVDPVGQEPMTRFYGRFTGQPTDFEHVLRHCKELVLNRSFGGELNRIATILLEVCERRRSYRDYTRPVICEALCAIIAAFPVYRSYVQPETRELRDEDVAVVRDAIGNARRGRPGLDPTLLDFIQDLLLLRLNGEEETEFVLRFQQLTGPVAAKGVEDTAFYRYTRLVSLNEVGGDPAVFGVTPEQFHRFAAAVQRRWPQTLLATSTHDTKRSEDVRARISLLSEAPDRWIAAVERWSHLNERHRRRSLPDRNAEYLFYQTLVGAWPIDSLRMDAYMAKAAREAKAHTSWTDPCKDYEDALAAFVRAAMENRDFLRDLEEFVSALIEPGRINALSQALIKLTAPGIPDIYQGCELWDLSLVDPDNRMPVDFDLRRRLMQRIAELSAEEAWAQADSGLPKMLLIRRALRLRRERPEAFGPGGGYDPIEAQGPKANHVVAFVRGGQVMTVVPRLVIGLSGNWDDTRLTLPTGRWRDQLTGVEFQAGGVGLSDLLRRFPVALLAREET